MDSLRKKTQLPRKTLPSQTIPPRGPVYQPIISDPVKPEGDKKKVPPKHERNFHLLIKLRRIVFFISIAFFVACVAYAGFFLWKSYSVSKKNEHRAGQKFFPHAGHGNRFFFHFRGGNQLNLMDKPMVELIFSSWERLASTIRGKILPTPSW